MKTSKYIIAFVVAVGMLYLAHTNLHLKPEFHTHTENGYTFEMTADVKAYENEPYKINLKITGPTNDNLKAVLRSTRKDQDSNTDIKKYGSMPLIQDDSLENRYYSDLNVGEKGSDFLYYFEIRDNVGGRLARFITPSGEPFVLKFSGRIPLFIIIMHIVFMFATIFLITIGTIHGYELIKNKTKTRTVILTFSLATIFSFLVTYPIGMIMSNYSFGGLWEGVPFGTDIVNNKNQSLFVYLLFITLAGMGSLSRGKFGKDIFSSKIIGIFPAIGFLILLTFFLIPNTIQVEPFIIKFICWGWIGLLGVLYLIKFLTTVKKRK